MNPRVLIPLASLALLLPGCSWLNGSGEPGESGEEAQRAGSAAAAVPQLGNPLLANKGDLNAVNVNVATEHELEAIDNGAEGEVVFSDPDNIAASEKNINILFENRLQGNSWFDDYNRALRFSRREGRPMLVWFHDSVSSPKSNTLGRNVLYTNRFDKWCRDRVTRVVIDTGEAPDELEARRPRYSLREARAMGRRFGVQRWPAVVVISMSGDTEVVFDGVDDIDWSGKEIAIRHAIERAEASYGKYKEKMRSRGYRDWTIVRKKAPLFARYQRYDHDTRRVYLKELGGRIGSVSVDNLSEEDRDYLRKQLTKHAD